MSNDAVEDDEDDNTPSFEERWLHQDAKKHLKEQKEKLAKKLFSMKNSIAKTRERAEKKKIDEHKAKLCKHSQS